jgi:hypothetical protein
MDIEIYRAKRIPRENQERFPRDLGHAWIVVNNRGILATPPSLAQPDTPNGQIAAELIARAMNDAHRAGMDEARRETRKAYDDFRNTFGKGD